MIKSQWRRRTAPLMSMDSSALSGLHRPEQTPTSPTFSRTPPDDDDASSSGGDACHHGVPFDEECEACDDEIAAGDQDDA